MMQKTYNSLTPQHPPNYHHHHYHHHHHRSKRSSPAFINDENHNQYFHDNGYYQTSTVTPSPPIQCSAYFIHRLDLDNYTAYTLRQAVDRVVTGPKSKGLKVKLSLPDEGLIIDNTPDPNQSWMYKTSELLYFWRDPYYPNIVVVVTINRSAYHSVGSFSASIFRLRGNESVQLFIQRAQEFFAQLSIRSLSRNQSKSRISQTPTIENIDVDNDRKTPRKKSKHRSVTRDRSDNELVRSSQPSPARSSATTTRTEFEPSKSIEANASFNHYNRRTYSETTVLSDTHTNNSTRYDHHYNDDNKLATSNSHFSGDIVAELMRELKEIRSEIAELKLEARFTPVRAISTSPFRTHVDDSRETIYSSPSFPKLRLQSDIDAETQTDLGLNISKSEESSNKNKTITNGYSMNNKSQNEPSNKRSSSSNLNNNEHDREEALYVKFYPINGTSNGKRSPSVQEENQRKPTLVKPRPLIKVAENNLLDSTESTSHALLNKNQSNSNSIEEDTSLKKTPIIIQKEIPKVLSTRVSSSAPVDTKSSSSSSSSINNGDVISFRSSLENTISTPEHYYENFPILIRMDTGQGSFYNIPIVNGNDSQEKQPQIYVSISDDRNTELQQQYLSQLFGSSNGIALLIPQQSSSNSSKETAPSKTQETPSTNQQYSQQALFANHLTNPLFNIDKQLLANTIANQFGVDKNSPYLQQLIANQHLFVTEKRTFANMVWQMTPEEINAMCSSPVTTSKYDIDKTTIDSNSSKSILKSNRLSRSISKKQRITWDRALE